MRGRADRSGFESYQALRGRRDRNVVERFFNKLKHYCAMGTRYEKRPINYLALIKLAATRVW